MLSHIWTRAAAGASAVALAAGLTANAEALELKCYPDDKLPELKKQMAAENMAPVVKFYLDTSDDKSGKIDPTKTYLTKGYIVMNPETRTGHRVARLEGRGLCVLTKMRDINLYDNSGPRPDPSSYMTAHDTGERDVETNRVIFHMATKKSEFPMMRGIETISGKEYYTYITADPKTGAGGFLSATLKGVIAEEFTKGIPSIDFARKEYGGALIEHGAQFTETGQNILSSKKGSSGEKLAQGPR